MGEIVSTKPNNVTTGVIDKDVQTHEDLQSVTFADRNGTLHTVFAHVNGPFKTPQDIVSAAEAGTLHVFESHDAAIEHWTTNVSPDADPNDHKRFIDALRALSTQSGGGY